MSDCTLIAYTSPAAVDAATFVVYGNSFSGLQSDFGEMKRTHSKEGRRTLSGRRASAPPKNCLEKTNKNKTNRNDTSTEREREREREREEIVVSIHNIFSRM